MSTRAGYAGGRTLPVLPGNPQLRPLDSVADRGPAPRGSPIRAASAAARQDAPARSRSSTVPTNKQRREAAQRHLQKQLERRAELAKKRRRNLGIVATVVAVAVVVV